jgi:hypothetical protein
MQRGENPTFDGGVVDTPVSGEGLTEDLIVGSFVAEFELGELDVTCGDERIEGEAGKVDLLANHRTVDLARWGNIHDDISEHFGLTAKARTGLDPAATLVAGLTRGP